jgi:hypothetical protein
MLYRSLCPDPTNIQLHLIEIQDALELEDRGYAERAVEREARVRCEVSVDKSQSPVTDHESPESLDTSKEIVVWAAVPAKPRHGVTPAVGAKRTLVDFFGGGLVEGKRKRQKVGAVRELSRPLQDLIRVPGYEHENAGTAVSCIPGAGLGLFVFKPVKEGGFICSYTGRVISLGECLDVNNKSEYCTTRGDGMIVDAAGEGWGPGKYANDAGDVLLDNSEIREGPDGYGIYSLMGAWKRGVRRL